MKSRHAFLLILLLVLIDQAIKIYIKTNFHLHEEYMVIDDWFRLHYLENSGMVFGLKSEGALFKILLIVARLAFTVAGIFIIRRLIRNGYGKGVIICAAFIYAGGVGNFIDNTFYGVIFGEGQLFQGKVVDMFYFPLIDTTWPSWIPFFGGRKLLFFQYVFNFADVCIDIGLFTFIAFRKKFLGDRKLTLRDSGERSAEA